MVPGLTQEHRGNNTTCPCVLDDLYVPHIESIGVFGSGGGVVVGGSGSVGTPPVVVVVVVGSVLIVW